MFRPSAVGQFDQSLEHKPQSELDFAACGVRALTRHRAERALAQNDAGVVPHDVVQRVIGFDARFEPVLLRQVEVLRERHVHEEC